ncbi:MAG: CarD family transcriptional regulator [Clostridia bacterium]|nr:CarD family transcriptional regulator [Clostridia bacterium]
MDYKKGDYIRYASNGVCLIDDIKSIDINRSKNPKSFYVLKPISASSSTIYVPLDNNELVSKMRYILSKTEIDSLINSVKNDKIDWISDRKERNNSFKQIIKDSDPRELLKLVSCIYLKKQELSADGKKLSSTDEGHLLQAEALIENEFAFVLKLDGLGVGNYIRAMLGI